MKKTILVLTENTQGGEWIATNRLTKAVKKFYPNLNFIYIAFGKDILRSDKNIFLGFIRSFVKDLVNSSKVITNITSFKKIDYVISTDYTLLLASLFVKSLKHAKKIYYFHGLKSQPLTNFDDFNHINIFEKNMETLGLIFSSYIFVPSNYSKEYIRNFLGPFKYFKKIFIVPNSVPGSFISKKKFKKTTNKIILYSGRLVNKKGLENLIKAIYMFKDRNDLVLYICYPAKSKDQKIFKYIYEYIQKHNLKNKIIFFKDLKLIKLRNIYRKSYVTILPSEIEMSPLCVIESLACGTPVIGTKVGNTTQILKQVDKSLLLNSNSPIDIYNKINWILRLNRSEVKKLINKGLDVGHKYTPCYSARSFVKILESLE